MVAAGLFKFTLMAIIIPVKFSTHAINYVPVTGLPSDVTSEKIQHGSVRHFESWFNGCTSFAMAYICRQFCKMTKTMLCKRARTSIGAKINDIRCPFRTCAMVLLFQFHIYDLICFQAIIYCSRCSTLVSQPGAKTDLTFRNLKQLTVKESLVHAPSPCLHVTA